MVTALFLDMVVLNLRVIEYCFNNFKWFIYINFYNKDNYYIRYNNIPYNY